MLFGNRYQLKDNLIIFDSATRPLTKLIFLIPLLLGLFLLRFLIAATFSSGHIDFSTLPSGGSEQSDGNSGSNGLIIAMLAFGLVAPMVLFGLAGIVGHHQVIADRDNSTIRSRFRFLRPWFDKSRKLKQPWKLGSSFSKRYGWTVRFAGTSQSLGRFLREHSARTFGMDLAKELKVEYDQIPVTELELPLSGRSVGMPKRPRRPTKTSLEVTEEDDRTIIARQPLLPLRYFTWGIGFIIVIPFILLSATTAYPDIASFVFFNFLLVYFFALIGWIVVSLYGDLLFGFRMELDQKQINIYRNFRLVARSSRLNIDDIINIYNDYRGVSIFSTQGCSRFFRHADKSERNYLHRYLVYWLQSLTIQAESQ